MARYGTVEMGGTRTSCAVGASPDDLSGSISFSTTDPAETLGKVAGFLGSESLDAVGIAAFGPLDLERGRTGVTPKGGWSGVDLVGPMRDAVDVPIGLDTDVNGAALGEGRWGAGRGLGTFAYVTVGTGIGGGALVDDLPIHGLGHPEMGHISVRRHPEDDYRGSCPFHGDCLEGLASGPAIQQRSGMRGQDLSGTDLEATVELEAFYLGQLMRSLVYILAPRRVILGGGVSRLAGLLDLVNERLIDELSGYPGLSEHEPGFVTTPGLGDLSGLAGGMILAEWAVERAKSSG